MTKFELSIAIKQTERYKLNAFYIVWAILGLLAATGLYNMYHWLHASVPFIAGLPRFFSIVGFGFFFLGLGAVYAYVPYQIASNRLSQVKLVATEDGIGPPPCLFGLIARAWMPWSELRLIDISRRGKKAHTLKLKDASGRIVSINLDSIDRSEDVEQILLAVEAWANGASWTQAAQDFRDALQNELRGLDHASQTELIEEELSRHFAPTTFVPLAPGSTLRNRTIKITRQLAFGGFSAVYVASEITGETVVVKELVTSRFESEDEKEKIHEHFKREARILAGLDHPQIVQVKDYFIEGGRNYLVLEHVAGRTLKELVRGEGRQDETKVVAWAKQMLEILTYLHEKDPPVVHRDFTPENLVLKNDGRIVLIDFGAANEFMSKATGTLIGKQGFMPPEQFRGKAEPKSDIYALGATLHYLLTGSEPEALTSVDAESGKGNISGRLMELLSHLTDLDRSRRPSTGEALIALEEIEASKAIPSTGLAKEKSVRK